MADHGQGYPVKASRADIPWNERTEPNRISPRECVANARNALNRAYDHKERAQIPVLIESLDWLRRALEQMVPKEDTSG